MQGQGNGWAVGFGGGDLKTGAQQSTNGFAHLRHHAVVTRTQQTLVKQQIVGDVVTTKFNRVFHAGVGGFYIGNVLFGRALGGQACGGWFDHAAQVLQLAQKIACEPELGLPRHHIGVKPIPLFGWQHACAHFGAGADQAFGYQRFHRFTNDGATDTILGTQHRFGWHRCAERVVPRYDGFAQ